MSRDGYVKMNDCDYYPEQMCATEVIGEGVMATVRLEFDGKNVRVKAFEVNADYIVCEPITGHLINEAGIDRMISQAIRDAWECTEGIHAPKPRGDVAAD